MLHPWPLAWWFPGRESLAEKGLPLLTWRGRGRQCQLGTAPKSWGLLHLYPGPEQGGLRNVLGPGLRGRGKGHEPKSQNSGMGVQLTHFSPLHNPEVIGFASYVGIASQGTLALGTRVTLVHSLHSTFPGQHISTFPHRVIFQGRSRSGDTRPHRLGLA